MWTRNWHRSRLTIVLGTLLAASGLPATILAREPDPTTGDPQAKTIQFKAPGSQAVATARAIVVVPRSYTDKNTAEHRYPVVYLLHGYSGNQTDWYQHSKTARKPLAALADRFGAIIVCPDGRFSSWYLDAPSDAENPADWQMETTIIKHLIPEIDRQYRTWAEPDGRAIVGLSMGGHGALYLAARNADHFAACASMSGVMDLRHSTKSYDLAKRLGAIEQHADRWTEASAITFVEKFAGRKIGIMIDCGWDDPFMADTRKVHEKMLSLKIPHDYVERPGAHTWDYWINALPYHMQFLSDRLKQAGEVTASAAASLPGERWTAEKANRWYAAQPWLVGCDFIPSTAINQLEMWQEDTFDEATIDRELGWAAGIGMNTVRVYLHDLAWQANREGFKQRMNHFLRIADKHKIRPLFVIFDDCWNDNPKIGKQPEPIPGVHNSGWMQSPGKAVVNNPAEWRRLEEYVRDVVTTFAKDERILLWDLYNEPGNSEQHVKSLPLLKKAFEWARAAGPSQPLSAGVWYDNKELNAFQLAASDVITFHNYNDAKSLTDQIAELKKLGRPVICTEWMRRPVSVVQSHLPIFAKEHVAAINWGLVSGKSQTIYPWGSKQGAPEPKPWFHDLFHKDGTPYDPAEIAVFKELTSKARATRRG